MWDAFYSGINRCNSIIANAHKVETDAVKGYVAEARFLRGVYYWYLAQTFGGVPIVEYRSSGDEPGHVLKMSMPIFLTTFSMPPTICLKKLVKGR